MDVVRLSTSPYNLYLLYSLLISTPFVYPKINTATHENQCIWSVEMNVTCFTVDVASSIIMSHFQNGCCLLWNPIWQEALGKLCYECRTAIFLFFTTLWLIIRMNRRNMGWTHRGHDQSQPITFSHTVSANRSSYVAFSNRCNLVWYAKKGGFRMSQVTEKGNFAALLRTSLGLFKKKYTSAETAWMVSIIFFFW